MGIYHIYVEPRGYLAMKEVVCWQKYIEGEEGVSNGEMSIEKREKNIKRSNKVISICH